MKGKLSAVIRRATTPAHRIDSPPTPSPISLLIVESQRLFRQSLQALLEREQDVATVIEGINGREAYRLTTEHRPDIVLLDVDISDPDAESVTNMIHKHLPRTRVLLLARYEEDRRIVASLQAGAFGYVLKDIDCTDFLRIIRATARGERVLLPIQPKGLVHTVPGALQYRQDDHRLSLMNLTDREQEILACAAAGRSNKEMADQLCVSVETVKTHLHHIYQKLSVAGRVEAILAYLRAQ